MQPLGANIIVGMLATYHSCVFQSDFSSSTFYSINEICLDSNPESCRSSWAMGLLLLPPFPPISLNTYSYQSLEAKPHLFLAKHICKLSHLSSHLATHLRIKCLPLSRNEFQTFNNKKKLFLSDRFSLVHSICAYGWWQKCVRIYAPFALENGWESQQNLFR